MKNYTTLIAAAIVLAFSSCQEKQNHPKNQNEIVGVYQYLGDLEGMSVMTDKYFLYTARTKEESATADSTDPFKKDFDALIIEGGTWTMQDSIITNTLLFGKKPNASGTFRWTCTFRGDTAICNILNKDNQVVKRLTTLKLKQTGTKNDLVGAFKYIEGGPIPEGLSIMTEDYFFFAGRRKNDLSEKDSKDFYKDQFNSLVCEVGKYTLQDSIVSCYMLFGKKGLIPSRNEPSYQFKVSYKGDTLIADVLNKYGEGRGNPSFHIRLE